MTENSSGGRVTSPSRRQKSVAANDHRSGTQYPMPVGQLRVIAARFEVVARSGRHRAILIVRCPFCRQMHAHQAKPEFDTGVRKAACGRGRYELTIRRELAVVA